MVSRSRWISLWILIKGHLRGAGTPDLSSTSRSWFLNKPMTRLLCPVIQPEPVYRRNFFRSNPANYLRHLNSIQHIYICIGLTPTLSLLNPPASHSLLCIISDTMSNNLTRSDSAEYWDTVDGPDLAALADLSQSLLQPIVTRTFLIFCHLSITYVYIYIFMDVLSKRARSCSAQHSAPTKRSPASKRFQVCHLFAFCIICMRSLACD